MQENFLKETQNKVRVCQKKRKTLKPVPELKKKKKAFN